MVRSGSVLCPAGPALLSLLRALLERPARSLSNEPTVCLSVSEKRASTMAGILVWLFVAMSWSAFGLSLSFMIIAILSLAEVRQFHSM